MKKKSIGKIIEICGAVIGLIGIMSSINYGISLLDIEGDSLIGFAVILGGSFVSFVILVLMAGFGHLICQVDTLVEIGKSKQNDNLDKHSDIKSSTNDNNQQKYNLDKHNDIKSSTNNNNQQKYNPDKHSDIKSSTNNNNQQKYHSNRNDIDGDFYRKDKNSNDDYLENEDDETFGEDFDYDTSIPKVYCPECGTKHDFDCPKCPNCGHKYKF